MVRQTVQLIIVCAIFLGSLAATLAEIGRRNYELRGYVDATKTLDIPFRIQRLGVNADLTHYDANELESQLRLMTQAGIYWIRQEFMWASIQPERDKFNWELYDPIIDALEAFPQLELVAVLTTTPVWARAENTHITGPPSQVHELARFSEAFAVRYGANVNYYQIWDEPNIALGWGGNNPNAAHYASMLQASYSMIHAADPRAIVLAGALAPTTETGPQNINEIRYLEDLYALGLAEYSDGVAAKPFGFSSPPYDRAVDMSVMNYSRIILLREVMVANGDGKTSLWASNWGWNSLPEEWNGDPSIWGQVEQTIQLRYTLDALDRAEREWPWIGGMILHHWNPAQLSHDPAWGFSLTTPTGNPGDLWQALVDRNAAKSAATNGLYRADSVFASYSGIWTFSDLGADIGWVQDSTVRFDYWGSDISVAVRQGDYVAYLYAQLDKDIPNVLPYDAQGNHFILLQSSDRRPVLSLVPVAQGLPLTSYQLLLKVHEIVPDEIDHRWPLAGFAVSSGDLTAPFRRQITIGWMTVAISLASVTYTITTLNLSWTRRVAHLLFSKLSRTSQLVFAQAASIALMLGMLMTWDTNSPAILRRESVPLMISILTSGLIYINEWGVTVAILSAGILFFIIFNHIEIGLWLVLFWAPFFLFPVELYQFAFPIAEIILLITLAAWMLQNLGRLAVGFGKGSQDLSGKELLSLFHPLDFLVLCWVILSAISLLWAEYANFAITEIRTLTIEPAIFYLILRTSTSKQDLYFLVSALLLSATVVALVGIVMWINGDGITAEGGSLRLVSVYGSPNNAALFLGKVLPISLALFLSPIVRRRRIVVAFAIVLMGIALILTQSAGALFIAIPASVAAMVVFHLGRRSLIPLLLGAVVVTLFSILLSASSARFDRITDLSQGTNFYRLRVWESSKQILADKPMTGIGMDQFLYVFRDKYMMPDAWQEPDLSHPHNIVFDWWIRLGILGMLLLVLFQFHFWKVALAAHKADAAEYFLALGIIGSMVNLLAHGLVDNSIFVYDLAFIFVFLIGSISLMANNSAIDQKPGKVL